jgi:hypothetical protein
MRKLQNKRAANQLPEAPVSMSIMARGMADDFNNILTMVLGACSLIDKDNPANLGLMQYVALIRASAERAAVLSDHLMRASVLEQEKIPSAAYRPEDPSRETPVLYTSARDKK